MGCLAGACPIEPTTDSLVASNADDRNQTLPFYTQTIRMLVRRKSIRLLGGSIRLIQNRLTPTVRRKQPGDGLEAAGERELSNNFPGTSRTSHALFCGSIREHRISKLLGCYQLYVAVSIHYPPAAFWNASVVAKHALTPESISCNVVIPNNDVLT